VKVLDANGKGFLSDVLYGLQWIYDNQSKKQLWLVNMSLGFSTDSPALLQATQRLSDSGTLIVASTGNRCSDDPGQEEGAGADGEGPTCDTPQTTTIKYPARHPWVLAVAATDDANKITDYSLVGAEVDIAAPGGIYKGKRILSTSIDGWYAYGDGTSQAAAHVTGALALTLQKKPHLSLHQIRTLLKNTATELGYKPTQQGRGLIAVEPLLAAPE
jgi:subtilisin family serine protease